VTAVDTNILVYAHRRDAEFHERAAAAVRRLAEGREHWAIPWPCVHEFLAVVTHPRIFELPSPLETAMTQIQICLESPLLKLIGESGAYWRTLAEILAQGRIVGPKIHDARVAAICQAYGIRELWSADRDFSRMRV
jgi:predicted nucleic acid-binding protein